MVRTDLPYYCIDCHKEFNNQIELSDHACIPIKIKKVPTTIKFKKKDGTIVKMKGIKYVSDTRCINNKSTAQNNTAFVDISKLNGKSTAQDDKDS